jgi:hypothetical protein
MLKKWKILFILPLILLGFLVWLEVPKTSKEERVLATDQGASTLVKTDATTAANSNDGISDQDLVTLLLGEHELLKLVNGEAEGQESIRKMFSWLNDVPNEDASAAILTVLNTGEDAFAFGRFAPGKDGYLKAYPTFRTALLDQLEKIDPAQAVKYGKSVLETSENPDEWALSLRALSRYAESASDKAFLHSKVQALLHKDAWLEEPSFSYLHSFDAAVADGQAVTIARLGELLEASPNKPVGHAATISMDRFFQRHTSQSVAYVVDHPEFLTTVTGFRASLMARVDPLEPAQMNSAESYLRADAFSAEEKHTFFLAFPNFNTTFSYNLISESELPTRPEMRERSIAAQTQLSQWLEENRYPEFEEDINGAVSRLAKVWKLEL